MITSSLPPELKVMIAGALLLAGGLLALRFPVDRDEESTSLAQAVETESGLSESSPTMPVTLTSPGSRFETVDEFVRRDVGVSGTTAERTSPPSGWSYTTLSEPEPVATNFPENHEAATSNETATLSYGGISFGGRSAESTAEREIMQYESLQQAVVESPPKPPYQPFQTTSSLTMPEPNPAFSTAQPSPSNLTELTQVVAEPGRIVSPSSVSVARPVMPSQTSVAVTPSAVENPVTVIRPVVSGSRSRDSVIYAPARTVIVPNRQ